VNQTVSCSPIVRHFRRDCDTFRSVRNKVADLLSNIENGVRDYYSLHYAQLRNSRYLVQTDK